MTTAELTDEQREARRTRTRDLIEARLTETWPAWRRPGRKPNLALAADIALDSLGDLAAEILVDGTMLRALTIRDGVATLELGEATEMVRIFAAGMRGVLDGNGASNYVEMEMTDGKTGEGFTVTVRRRERPTPHEFRQQAEAKVAELEKQLAEYEPLNPQQCPAGKHADWLVDSEYAHACPWCRIAELEADPARRVLGTTEQADTETAPTADRATEMWTVWAEDESTLGHYTDEVTAKLAVIEYHQETETPDLDFVYGWNEHAGRLELLANGDDTGLRVKRDKVQGKQPAPAADRAAIARVGPVLPKLRRSDK